MNKKKLKEMFHFFGNEKRTIKIGARLILILSVYTFLYPVIMQLVVDVAIPKKDMIFVGILSVILVVMISIKFLVDRGIEIDRKSCFYDNDVNIKNKLFSTIQYASISELDSIQAGNLFQIVGTQSLEASHLFVWNFVGIICVRLTLIVIIAIILLILDFKIGIIVISIFTISYLLLIPMYKKNMRVYRKLKNLVIDLQGNMNEYIESYSTTKTLRLEEINLSQINEMLDKCKNEIIKSDKIIAIHNALFSLLTFTSVIVVLAISGNKLGLGIGMSSTVMLMIDYIDDINRHMKSLLEHAHSLISRYNCFLNVLKTNSIKKEDDNGTRKLEGIESIEFRDVVLSYDGENIVLENINFKIDKKMQIALVGKSGAGKTSFVNLLPRFYDISSGSILINGIDYREYKLEELRKHISYVFQEPVILERSVIDNILIGNDKDIKFFQVKELCKKLGLDDKIENLYHGYDCVINSNIDSLSYGEKQLLNFVRVILKDSDVVILDEVTSNLDLEFEQRVLEASKELISNKICFVIAHRLNTIKNADLIMYIDDKKIVEMGTHKELIKKHGYYYNLYMSKEYN